MRLEEMEYEEVFAYLKRKDVGGMRPYGNHYFTTELKINLEGGMYKDFFCRICLKHLREVVLETHPCLSPIDPTSQPRSIY